MSGYKLESLETVTGPAALVRLRQLAVRALAAPEREVVDEGDGRHSVNFIPHAVAAALIQRIDQGGDAKEVLSWCLRAVQHGVDLGDGEPGRDDA
jgi:hypothetical protein